MSRSNRWTRLIGWLLAPALMVGCASHWSAVTLETVASPVESEADPDVERVWEVRERTRVESSRVGATILSRGERLILRDAEWRAESAARWVPEPGAALSYSVERQDIPDGVAIGVLVGVAVLVAVTGAVLTVLALEELL